MRLAAMTTCVLAICSSPVWAGLSEESDINEGLVAIAAADKIRRECNTIGGRMFKAQSYANKLKDAARARGYSEAEIDAYLGSKAERAKVRAERNAYFESKGASNLNPASLCVLGHAEIASQSRIGVLLRSK